MPTLIYLSVRDIPHPTIVRQISMPQPKLVVLLFCLVVPAWMPFVILRPALFARLFPSNAESANSAYYITFVFVVLVLIVGVVSFLTWKYSTAIWTPWPSGCRKLLVFVLVLLPLFLFHASNCAEHIRSITYWTAADRPDANQMLASLYEHEWGSVTFDWTLVGIACGSVVALVAPVLEEVVLTGFLLNRVAKAYGFFAAAAGIPLCFVLFHAIKLGVDAQLITLFFASLTYVTIRICSGSLFLAIAAHFTINAVIFLPKWLVAVIYFKRI